MGVESAAERMVLVESGRSKRAFFPVTHHPCLGSWRALPYSAAGGKKSMIRQALDQLKHDIPLLDYLQAHHWAATRRLSRGRWMGLCPLPQNPQPNLGVDP